MTNNKYNLSKEYQFDITVTDNTYAGKLALPYVTAAVKSPDTVAKGYVRTIDGLNSKAVISLSASTWLCILYVTVSSLPLFTVVAVPQ